jgi:DNA-binding MarR family transcriptional regulator
MTSSAQDRVDQALAEWRAACPEHATEGPAVTLRLLVLGKYLEAHAAESLAPLGLQPWEVDVLGALRRQGEPYTLAAGKLARRLLLTCSGMTHRLDRLESRGLVARVPTPEDRRRVLVRLTEAGRALVDRAIELRICETERLLSVLDAAEREQLTGLLRRLALALEADHEAPCGGAATTRAAAPEEAP